MNIEKIYGKIVALLREIKLRKLNNLECYPSSFFIGKIGLEWWYTKKSYKFCDDLSKMIIASNNKFEGGDYKHFSSVIINAIQQNGFNKELFDPDVIFKSEACSLLDAKNVTDYKTLSMKLYRILIKTLQESITNWMILYPLCLTNSETFYFKSLDLILLSPDDLSYWEEISSDYKSSTGFNPSNGYNYNMCIIPNAYKVPNNWLILKTNGTEKDAIRKVIYTFRKFITIVCAFNSRSYDTLHNCVEYDTPRYCILFPEDETSNFSLKIDSIPFLQPPFASNFVVNIETLKEIDSYLMSINSLSIEYKNRFETATQFINYGILASSDIEKFIHYYIALDALFGKRNDVKDSIKKGLFTLKKIDEKIDEKADKLFDLRNEILHGGSSSLREWKGYEKYLTQYECDPVNDIALICYRSILNYLEYVKVR